MAIGLGCLQYVLDEGERYDWFNDGNILATACVAVAALAFFAYWELRVVENPIVDLRILIKNRTVWVCCLLAANLAFSLFGGVILTPQFQQGVLNFTATLSGLSILTRALAIMVMTFVTLFLLNRFKLTAAALARRSALSSLRYANIATASVITTTSDFGSFVPVLVIGGVGFGMLFVPLSVSLLTTVHGADTQKATSLLSLCQQLGGSISTASLVTLLDRRAAFHLDNLAGDISLGRHPVAQALENNVSHQALAQIVGVQATTMAFADAFTFLGYVTLALTPLVLLLIPARSKSPTAPQAFAVD